MSSITTRDGATIYYKDWGRGHPLVFSHGWPLNADAWEDAMFYFSARGYRCIAADRRGHGRSSQPWNGNDLDSYADDLAELVVSLDLKGAVLIGHSTGGGEVARYIGRHGTARVAAAILVSDITPLMLKTDANPQGTPLSAFDRLRSAVRADRAQFYRDLAEPFYGANRSCARVSQALKDTFWNQSMMTGLPASYFCIEAFSETDLNVDLRTIDVPTLIIHGDDDQIVPIAASALLSAKIIANAELAIYAGAPHGLPATMKDRLNVDLERFIKKIGA